MKILIAPWGNPLGWRNITYILKDESEEVRTESITSLKALHRKFDHVIVLATESLIDVSESKNSPLYQFYSATVLDQKKKGFQNYESIRSSIRDFIQRSLKEVGIDNAKVCVLPTFGSPGGVINFKGTPDDYLSLGLLEIEKIIGEIGKELDEISLDLTHGINFLTSMTVRLCDMITDVELMKKRNRKVIETKYYNSEPYSSGKKNQEYEIWAVYKSRKSKIDLPYMRIKEESQNIIRINREDNENRELFKSINSEYSNIVKNIITSIYFPLPLLMEYLVAEASFKELTSDNLRKLWIEGVSVSENLIEKHVSLNSSKVYSFLLASALINVVKADKNIKSMKDASSNIYGKISEIGSTLIGNEIRKLEDTIRKMHSSSKNYILYKEAINENIEDTGHNQPDRRIMIAHAGFQRDYVKVWKDGTLEYTIEEEKILNLFK